MRTTTMTTTTAIMTRTTPWCVQMQDGGEEVGVEGMKGGGRKGQSMMVTIHSSFAPIESAPEWTSAVRCKACRVRSSQVVLCLLVYAFCNSLQAEIYSIISCVYCLP